MTDTSVDEVASLRLNPRRSVTAPLAPSKPARPQRSSLGASSSTNSGVETLYSHPYVKIVCFTAGRSVSGHFSKNESSADIEPEGLPSSSQMERTLAIGAFQIYRAPESVAFVRCGSALQPIMPKSQCWAIDEQTACFVLQIRKPTYWRIELPLSDELDQSRAQQLREVWNKVLQFEKTPCPFTRNFTVELPVRPSTPLKKRPWTPAVREASMGWSPVPLVISSPPQFAATPRLRSDMADRRISDFGLNSTPEQTAMLPSQPEAPAKELDDTRALLDTLVTKEPQVEPLVKQSVVSELVGQLDGGGEQPTITVDWHEDIVAMPVAVSVKPPPFQATLVETSVSPAVQVDAIELQSVEAETSLPVLRIASNTVIDTAHTLSGNSLPASAKMVLRNAVASMEPDMDDGPSLFEDDGDREPEALEGSGRLHVRRKRVTAFASRRAATVPNLDMASSPILRFPSGKAQAETRVLSRSSGSVSPADSTASFHSSESALHSPITPPILTPPISQNGSPTKAFPSSLDHVPRLEHFAHTRDSSDMTVTATSVLPSTVGAVQHEPAQSEEDSVSIPDIHSQVAGSSTADATSSRQLIDLSLTKTESVTSTSSFISAASTAIISVEDRRKTQLRHRPTTSLSMALHRPLSPLPPAADLFAPGNFSARSHHATPSRAVSRFEMAKRLPSAIIAKTLEILMAPPSHLVDLMLRAAAMIAAGEWRGVVFGLGDEGQPMDVKWDWSDDDDGALEGWEETAYDFDADATVVRRRPNARPAINIKDESTSLDGDEEDSASEVYQTPAEEMDSVQWSRSWEVD